MTSQTEQVLTQYCSSGEHCYDCRAKHDFPCPIGFTEHTLPSRGVGDTLAKTIHALSAGLVKPCGGCRKRQKKLNKWFPYKRTKHA